MVLELLSIFLYEFYFPIRMENLVRINEKVLFFSKTLAVRKILKVLFPNGGSSVKTRFLIARVFSLGNLLHRRFRSLLGFAGDGMPFAAQPSPSLALSVCCCHRTWRLRCQFIWFFVGVADPGQLVSLLSSDKIFSSPSFFSDLLYFQDVVVFAFPIYCSNPSFLT